LKRLEVFLFTLKKFKADIFGKTTYIHLLTETKLYFLLNLFLITFEDNKFDMTYLIKLLEINISANIFLIRLGNNFRTMGPKIIKALCRLLS